MDDAHLEVNFRDSDEEHGDWGRESETTTSYVQFKDTHLRLSLHDPDQEAIDPALQDTVLHSPSFTRRSSSTSSYETLELAREQCTLFQAVLRDTSSGKSPESLDLLQLLRDGLTRLQTELHSQIALAEQEDELNKCLTVNDLVHKALAEYHTVMHEPESATTNTDAPSTAPECNGPSEPLERELMELFAASPLPEVAVPVPQPLIKTRSAQEFEDFFSAHSEPIVFSPLSKCNLREAHDRQTNKLPTTVI